LVLAVSALVGAFLGSGLGALSCVGYLDADAGAVDASTLDAPRADDGTAATGDAAPDASPSKYAAAVLASGPLLYLRFGETSGSTAVDEMHNANGQYPLGGATLGVAGALANDSNTAVHVDGKHGIDMPRGEDFAGPNQAFTVELWVKPDSTGPAFLVDNENQTRGGWVISSVAWVAFERYADSTVHVAAVSAGPLAAQSWHHIVGACDGTNQALWIDGDLAGSSQGPLTLPSVTVNWTVGAENCHPNPCTTNAFVGAIDELAVYGRALSQNEVLAHFQAAH
jgi:hypothetical protein